MIIAVTDVWHSWQLIRGKLSYQVCHMDNHIAVQEILWGLSFEPQLGAWGKLKNRESVYQAADK